MAQWKRVVHQGAQLVKSRHLLLDPSSSRSSSSSLAGKLAHRCRGRLLSDLAGPSGANANAKRAFSDYASAKSSQVVSDDLLKFQRELQSNLSKFQSELRQAEDCRYTMMKLDLAMVEADMKGIRSDVWFARWFLLSLGYGCGALTLYHRYCDNKRLKGAI